MAGRQYFTRNTFQFLSELADNNDREWFAENKHRYDADVKDASLGFIEDFAAHLEKLSPHFMATPRSLFRIYRDVRFSKDKSPYKTHAGIHFRHEQSKNAHAPGTTCTSSPAPSSRAWGSGTPSRRRCGRSASTSSQSPQRGRGPRAARNSGIPWSSKGIG